jgi:hypothetical protein
MIKANVFHVLNALVVLMNSSTIVDQHVLIHAQPNLKHALNNVYLAVPATMVLFD